MLIPTGCGITRDAPPPIKGTGMPSSTAGRAPNRALSLATLMWLAPLLGCKPAATDQVASPQDPVSVSVQDRISIPPALGIGIPSDMRYWHRLRSVMIADHQSGIVLRLGLDHGRSEVICRKGDGPNELQRPVAIALTPTELRIADVGRGRVLAVDEECQFGWARALEATGYGNEASLLTTGSFAEPVGGFDGALVRVTDTTSAEPRFIGQALPLPAGMTPATVRSQITRGETPELFENNVLVTQLEHGPDIVIASLANTWVARFDSSGEERWRTVLDLGASRDSLLSYYHDLNESESDPRRIHPYEVFADLEAQGGKVWVLSSPHLPSTEVWQLNAETGRVESRFIVPDLRHPMEFTLLVGASALVLADGGETVAEIALPSPEGGTR